MAARSTFHYLEYLNFSHKRRLHQRINYLKEMVLQLEKALLYVKAPRAIYTPPEEVVLPFIQSDYHSVQSFTYSIKAVLQRV